MPTPTTLSIVVGVALLVSYPRIYGIVLYSLEKIPLESYFIIPLFLIFPRTTLTFIFLKFTDVSENIGLSFLLCTPPFILDVFMLKRKFKVSWLKKGSDEAKNAFPPLESEEGDDPCNKDQNN